MAFHQIARILLPQDHCYREWIEEQPMHNQMVLVNLREVGLSGSAFGVVDDEPRRRERKQPKG